MVKVAIIGNKGSAFNLIQQIKQAIKEHGIEWSIQGICIDNDNESQTSDLPVLSGTKDISKLLAMGDLRFLFALFKPEKMKERYELVRNMGIPIERFVNFIHPLAYISPDVKMGFGNIIFSNAVVQSNVSLGNFNFINSGCVVEHETILGNANFLASGVIIGSKVSFNECNFAGLNSSVRENVRIDKNVYIGMGSVVLDDFTDAIIYGNPAKERKG